MGPADPAKRSDPLELMQCNNGTYPYKLHFLKGVRVEDLLEMGVEEIEGRNRCQEVAVHFTPTSLRPT